MTSNRLASWMLVVAAAAACDSPPSPTPIATPTPGSTGAAQVTRVVMGTPPALTAIGESVHLALTASYSDGTSRDIAAEATWTSSLSDVIQVARGDATALVFGATYVQARFGRFSVGPFVLRATPSGTFAILGGVREPGAGGLGEVRVSSASSGIETVTRIGGAFTLGALVDQRLLFEKTGYEDVATRVDPADAPPSIPMQRVVRLAPEGNVKTTIAPNDMDYDVGDGERCFPCRLVRLVGAAGTTVRVRVRWTPAPGVALKLWTASGTSDPNGPGEIIRDVFGDSDDVRLYVGHRQGSARPYVTVEVTATSLAPPSVILRPTSAWLR